MDGVSYLGNCPTGNGGEFIGGFIGGVYNYTWFIQHPVSSGSFYHAAALNAWQVVVQPQALGQIKAVPYTLIYQPPGKDSTGSFSTMASYGLTMAVDTKLVNNQSTTIDNKDTDASTLNWSESYKIPALAAIGGSVGIGATLDSASQSWDHNTALGAGRSIESNSGTGSTSQTTSTVTLKSSGANPGSSGPYGSEAFWGDTFELLVHPQYGFWVFGGQPVVTMLAARASAGNSTAIPMPMLAHVEVGDLYSCAFQTGPFAAGVPLLPQPVTQQPIDILNKDDCQQLLQLDPFYNAGQGLASSLNPLISSGRLSPVVGNCVYGCDAVTQTSCPSCSFSSSIQYSQNTTTTSVASFTTTFQDVLVSSDAIGMSWNALWFSGSDTVTSAETTTNSANWTLSLQTSVAATAQSSTTITGSFAQNSWLPPGQSNEYTYQDLVFGTFVWVDPLAQAAPYPDAPPTSLQPPDGGSPAP
jgi:hypothetical protein